MGGTLLIGERGEVDVRWVANESAIELRVTRVQPFKREVVNSLIWCLRESGRQSLLGFGW